VIASFFSGVHAFFSSAAWTTLQISFLVALALLWVASIRWVRRDAKSRIADRLHVRLATVLGAVPPFFGPLIYLLFRPSDTLADVREHELEARAIEARLGTLALACPECRTPVKAEFLVCPSCAARLKDACRSCGKPLDNNWNVCPYCEAPAPGLEIETLDGGAVTDRRAEDRETR
jgi:RNA polymerase subunit RPABC4/transcription elongation factor Spt4